MPRKKPTAQAAEVQASVTDEAPETTVTPQGPDKASEKGETFAEKEDGKRQFQDPRGWHTIKLGDGRELRYSRSTRFQQDRIEFAAIEEGVDPKPTKESGDTQWLRDHGWRWRNEEKVWTKQLGKNSDEQPYARANSEAAAHEEFVELANTIRQRNGLEPIDFQFSQGRDI